jgi:hypothetical protein
VRPAREFPLGTCGQYRIPRRGVLLWRNTMDKKWEKWADHEPKVKKFVAERVYGRGGNSADVKDIVSDVMLKFIETDKEINLSYIYSITKSVIKEHFSGFDYPYNHTDTTDNDTIDIIDADILEPFVRSLDWEEKVAWYCMIKKLRLKDAAISISYSRKAKKTVSLGCVYWIERKVMEKLAKHLKVSYKKVSSAVKNLKNAWHELTWEEWLSYTAEGQAYEEMQVEMKNGWTPLMFAGE